MSWPVLFFFAQVSYQSLQFRRARYLRLPTSTPSPSTHKSLSARPLGLRVPITPRPRTFPSRANAPDPDDTPTIITPLKRSTSPLRPSSPPKLMNPFRPRRTSLLGQATSAPGSIVADEVERDKLPPRTPFARRVLLKGTGDSSPLWLTPGVSTREKLNQELRLPVRPRR